MSAGSWALWAWTAVGLAALWGLVACLLVWVLGRPSKSESAIETDSASPATEADP